MRVLVLANMYPPHHYGGYELNCLEYVRWLERGGHRVAVLTSDVRVPGVEEAIDDDDICRRLRLYWDDHELLSPSLVACLRHERHNQQALDDAIVEHAPDVVSVWHMGAMSLSLLTECHRRGLPLVHVVNDDWLVYGPTVDRWTRAWRRWRRVAPLATRVLGVPCGLPDLGSQGAFCFISAATRRTAETEGRWRFPRATIGYCGVNVDEFPIATVPARPTWSWRLLSVGRIDDRKGIDSAIRALALLPATATLEVVGRGDDRYLATLKRLAADVGVGERVRFSVADRADLSAIYRAADVFVFPPRWAEPFGLVPLEAMACSTPVVATGTGGSDEFLIDDANCLRVPVDDHAALAAAVRRLAADPTLRGSLRDAGHRTASELSLPRWFAVLDAWHVAAATGFVDGVPSDRRPIGDVLGDGFAQSSH